MELMDDELVALVKKGDRKAFDKLVSRYKDKMFGLTYRMTGERESALDLMQETFFRAFTCLGKFRGDSSFSSWLYRIAANKTLNYLKRKKLVEFVTLTRHNTAQSAYEIIDEVETSELSHAIAAAIDELPAKQKLAFNLRYFDGLQFGEIAGILGKSESTVKTNYQKAIEKLQKRLKEFR